MYHDEELLKAKRLAKMEEEAALRREKEKFEDKVSIYDEYIEFEGRKLTFSERIVEKLGIRMYIPDELQLIDENITKMMFPNGKAPLCVYSSEKPLMNISFNKMGDEIPQSNIKAYLALQKRILECIGPNVKIIKSYEKTVKDMTFGILEFYSKALDGSLFNLFLIQFTKEGQIIIGFNIQSNHIDRLRPLIMEMIESYEILEEGEIKE